MLYIVYVIYFVENLFNWMIHVDPSCIWINHHLKLVLLFAAMLNDWQLFKTRFSSEKLLGFTRKNVGISAGEDKSEIMRLNSGEPISHMCLPRFLLLFNVVYFK